MGVLQAMKPFWPLLFTFVLPRAINYYRVIKTAYRTRPPPRPLPSKTSRGLNALFVSICVFLYSSLPFRGDLEDQNIFVITQSRLSTSTEMLFTRYAMFRENRALTPFDELLRSKLNTQTLRSIYLRFGPRTLTNCVFCHPDDLTSYPLYHISTTLLLPHLYHILTLGLATSETISGPEASRYRRRTLLGGLLLAVIDLYLTTGYAPTIPASTPGPAGPFWLAATLRPLALCLFDAVVAFFIYASATGRFLLFSAPAQNDPELVRRRTDALLTQSNTALQMAATSLRTLTIVRNTVARDERLKAGDDEYWRRVVAVEGEGASEVFDDEEVQEAVSRAYGNGSVDVQSLKREADAFVKGVMKGLQST